MRPILRLLARLSGSVTPPLAKEELQGEALAQMLERQPGFRVLRALDNGDHVEQLRPCAADEQVGLVIDTETTGLNPNEDRLIEIAAQSFIFNPDGEILEVERVKSWMENPGRPITDRISKLTGLSNQTLEGKRFDDVAITGALATADLVIAHNAAFDRPFLDARFPGLRYRAWACSLTQLDWLDLGFDGRALGHLVLQSGRFFEGHRAGNDVEALTFLLAVKTADGRSVLSHLLSSCTLDSFRVEAVGAPFDAKDLLRSRGYRWNPSLRFWWREIDTAQEGEEVAWLDQQVYQRRGKAIIRRITPSERFASRD